MDQSTLIKMRKCIMGFNVVVIIAAIAIGGMNFLSRESSDQSKEQVCKKLMDTTSFSHTNCVEFMKNNHFSCTCKL